MKKQTKAQRIEAALNGLMARQIINYHASDSPREWEISFKGGRGYKGFSLVRVSSLNIHLKKKKDMIEDMRAVVLGMEKSTSDCCNATTERLNLFLARLQEPPTPQKLNRFQRVATSFCTHIAKIYLDIKLK